MLILAFFHVQSKYINLNNVKDESADKKINRNELISILHARIMAVHSGEPVTKRKSIFS